MRTLLNILKWNLPLICVMLLILYLKRFDLEKQLLQTAAILPKIRNIHPRCFTLTASSLYRAERVERITASKMNYHANFQQISFLTTFTMDMFLIRSNLWYIHIFFKLSEVMTSFSRIIDEILTFWGKFSSPEPFNVWSRATPHLNQKTQLTRSNYIAVHYFQNQKWFKIAIFG